MGAKVCKQSTVGLLGMVLRRGDPAVVTCRVLDAIEITPDDQGTIQEGNGAEMAKKSKA